MTTDLFNHQAMQSRWRRFLRWLLLPLLPLLACACTPKTVPVPNAAGSPLGKAEAYVEAAQSYASADGQSLLSKAIEQIRVGAAAVSEIAKSASESVFSAGQRAAVSETKREAAQERYDNAIIGGRGRFYGLLCIGVGILGFALLLYSKYGTWFTGIAGIISTVLLCASIWGGLLWFVVVKHWLGHGGTEGGA